jgi:hypothetical protein
LSTPSATHEPSGYGHVDTVEVGATDDDTLELASVELLVGTELLGTSELLVTIELLVLELLVSELLDVDDNGMEDDVAKNSTPKWCTWKPRRTILVTCSSIDQCRSDSS